MRSKKKTQEKCIKKMNGDNKYFPFRCFICLDFVKYGKGLKIQYIIIFYVYICKAIGPCTHIYNTVRIEFMCKQKCGKCDERDEKTNE